MGISGGSSWLRELLGGLLQDLGPRVGLLQEGFRAGCWFVAPGRSRAGSCVSLCQTTRGGEMAAAFGAPEVLRADQRAAESSDVPANPPPLLPPWQKPHQRQQEVPGTWRAAQGQDSYGPACPGFQDMLLQQTMPGLCRQSAVPSGQSRRVSTGTQGPSEHGMHEALGAGKISRETSSTAVSNPSYCKALREGWGPEKIIPK